MDLDGDSDQKDLLPGWILLHGHLALCLLVLSADKVCKQFRSRSGPTIVCPDLDPNYGIC